MAEALENSSRVLAYVKNHSLGFSHRICLGLSRANIALTLLLRSMMAIH